MGKVSSFYRYSDTYGIRSSKEKKPGKKKKSVVAKEFSEGLKRRATAAEMKFCEILDEYGFRYEFQKPLKHSGTFAIVDFYLPDFCVVVEVDGGYHADPVQAWEDGLRTGRLINKNNIKKVIRFTNEMVIESPEKVVRSLCKAILPQCAKFGV